MTDRDFAITLPLPPRASASALRQQLLEHFERSRPRVGERFLSDHELARLARLSRPTVRRALDDLQREGWIERRPGIGTFIGPRASRPNGDRHLAYGSARKTVRLALLMHLLGDLVHDWYVAGLIQGIDSAAEETGVALELLGNHDGNVASASRRLLQSKPDVLAFAAPPVRHAVLVGEAHRLEIPCIGTGTLLPTMQVPAVMEDGEGGARRAVEYLASKGHQRIGMISPTFALPWVFQRRLGFMNGLAQAGLDPDDGMLLWLDKHDRPEAGQVLMRYLERRKPTAVFLSSWVLGETLARLVKAGRLNIPRDLSVICFDQHPQMGQWLGTHSAAFIAIPLLEMGRRLAQMARTLADGGSVDPVTTLPCNLIEGDSVATVSPAN